MPFINRTLLTRSAFSILTTTINSVCFKDCKHFKFVFVTVVKRSVRSREKEIVIFWKANLDNCFKKQIRYRGSPEISTYLFHYTIPSCAPSWKCPNFAHRTNYARLWSGRNNFNFYFDSHTSENKLILVVAYLTTMYQAKGRITDCRSQ
jgi:hypothetical protein